MFSTDSRLARSREHFGAQLIDLLTQFGGGFGVCPRGLLRFRGDSLSRSAVRVGAGRFVRKAAPSRPRAARFRPTRFLLPSERACVRARCRPDRYRPARSGSGWSTLRRAAAELPSATIRSSSPLRAHAAWIASRAWFFSSSPVRTSCISCSSSATLCASAVALGFVLLEAAFQIGRFLLGARPCAARCWRLRGPAIRGGPSCARLRGSSPRVAGARRSAALRARRRLPALSGARRRYRRPAWSGL